MCLFGARRLSQQSYSFSPEPPKRCLHPYVRRYRTKSVDYFGTLCPAQTTRQPYSAYCVEGQFCELRPMKNILRHDSCERVGEAEEQKYTRRMARRALRLALLGILLVLTVSSCEGGGPEEAKARTIPEKGPLSAGRYSTQEFEPSFSFALGEGWHVWYPEEPYSVELAEGEGNDKQLAFYKVQEVFEPREHDGEVYFEARSAPNDLTAWFHRHPYVDTGELRLSRSLRTSP